MSYSLRFVTARGNTEIHVESLSWDAVIGNYPGICEHCGKKGIRYLAHVKQDLYDTVKRTEDGVLQTPDDIVEKTVEETTTEIVAIVDGMTTKTIAVGCVCVGHYLRDCGVDLGLAERMQREVNTITQSLQQIARLELAKEPKNLAASIRHAETVRLLGMRCSFARQVNTWKLPPATGTRVQNMQYLSGNDYHDAATRWKRENFGYWNRNVKSDLLIEFFDRRIRECQRKLEAFQRRGRYV